MEFYAGKGAGDKIWELVLSAKSHAYIISPWLGKKEVKGLKELRNKRVCVKVVTKEKENNAVKLLETRKIDLFIVLIAFLLMGAGITLSVLYRPFVMLIPLSILLLPFSFKKALPDWVKIDEELHAKIYIVDDVVVLSSANLTSSGRKRNVEFVLVLRGQEAREVLSQLSPLMERWGLAGRI